MDLLTIVPVFFLSGFVIFRMLRVARIFHLFRLNAKYDSFNVITTVLFEKRNQIISSVFIVLILMLASSLCMYSVEHEAQPEVFKNAFSGIWWSMSTLLTVGYGDIYPVTTLGRVMAICIAYLGVGAVAIPTGIISAGFVEQYQRKSNILNIRQADIKDIAEIFVDKRYAGKTIEEIEESDQVSIFLILRDDLSILPQKDTILKLNVAFHVDEVIGIHRVSWENIIKPDSTIQGRDGSTATGVIKMNDKLVVILDFESIVSSISPETGLRVNDIDNMESRDRSDSTILIAEDSALLSKLITDCLKKAGYVKLIVTENGQEAWDKICELKAAGDITEKLN